jgi:hypothetical protein
MAVWQVAVNNGDYRFLRDTALPTIGLKKRNDRRLHRRKENRAAFLAGMERMVGAVSHFPSVIGYTIFNEGWGQFDHASVYRRLKALDASRIVDSVSGWFQPRLDRDLESDVKSIHVYFKPIKVSLADRPLILSEFGGYSYRIAENAYNLKKNYGYRTLKTEPEFTEALRALYFGEVVPAIGAGLSAAVYTQLSDVEDETNGLVTYDRRRIKADPRELREIADALFAAFAKASSADP